MSQSKLSFGSFSFLSHQISPKQGPSLQFLRKQEESDKISPYVYCKSRNNPPRPFDGGILRRSDRWLNLSYPLEGDIRKIEPGMEIECITNRDGTAEIIEPKPQVGCERER